MKLNYFNQYDIEKFINYINAETSRERDKIYNRHLYQFINKQIESVLKSFNKNHNNFIMSNYDDLKQEIHIYIYQRVLPVLNLSKINAIQNLLQIAIKNQLINFYRLSEVKKNIKFDFNDYNFDNEENQIDEEEINHTAIIESINEKINEKINQQTNANCVASVYLQLLKNYILEHDYNASGFGEYCMKRMNIQKSQYLNISHSLGLKTIAFKSLKNSN